MVQTTSYKSKWECKTGALSIWGAFFVMISERLCIIETFEQNWRGNFLILILTEQPTSNHG